MYFIDFQTLNHTRAIGGIRLFVRTREHASRGRASDVSMKSLLQRWRISCPPGLL